VECKSGNGRTPFWSAAWNGNEAVMKLLLEKGADVGSKDTRNGRTPLSWAAKNGHEALVKLMLERGADLESKDTHHGRTPLSWAAENGHEVVVKLLLEKGADVGCKSDSGRTPLGWAAWNGHEAVMELLLKEADLECKSINGRCRSGRLHRKDRRRCEANARERRRGTPELEKAEKALLIIFRLPELLFPASPFFFCRWFRW
jgi:ankyrin repeat protein